MDATAQWEVVTGDSLEVMRSWPAGSIDAIVTSPPYADQRAYVPGEVGGRDVVDRRVRSRARGRRARSAAPTKWVDWLAPYTAEMLRVLSPSGSAMVNLGVIMRDGEEHDCTDAILRQCRAQGWKVLHRLVWAKPNGQVPSAPGYLTSAHEYVLWIAPSITPWRAYEQPAGSPASREVRTPHAPASAARIRALYSGAGTNSAQGRTHRLHPDGARPTTVMTFSVGGTPNPNQHPARMPVKMACHLVALCCPPGGLVADPFSGNATTGIGATRLGRRYLGVEMDAGYAEDSRERLRGDVGLLAAPVEPDPEQLTIEEERVSDAG